LLLFLGLEGSTTVVLSYGAWAFTTAGLAPTGLCRPSLDTHTSVRTGRSMSEAVRFLTSELLIANVGAVREFITSIARDGRLLTPGRAEAAPTAHEEFKHGVIVIPVTDRERVNADSALSEFRLQNVV
jgi:hypothetical protein